MLQSRNCIRLGQVLMDENRQFFILCNNCHTDIKNMPEFRRHLEKCEGLENIFQEGHTLTYNTDKSTQLFGKTAKGIKEFLIYDYADVDAQLSETEKNFIDLINIEEELLDPKWYSDLSPEENNAITQKSSKQYEVLVEEVTPFVQFKENVKSNTHIIIQHTPEVSDMNTPVTNVISSKKVIPKTKVKPTMKRKLSTSKAQNAYPLPHLPQSQTEIGLQKSSASFQGENSCQTTAIKRFRTENGKPKSFTIAPVANPTLLLSKSNQPLVASAPPLYSNDMPVSPLDNTASIPLNQNSQPAKEKQTAQILNKLQNLGLQVKRTQPFPTPDLEACKKTNDKTLEILLKLQSKGMKVKVLNKRSTPATINNHLNMAPEMSVNFGNTNTIEANVTAKQNVNKNLIIRKVN